MFPNRKPQPTIAAARRDDERNQYPRVAQSGLRFRLMWTMSFPLSRQSNAAGDGGVPAASSSVPSGAIAGSGAETLSPVRPLSMSALTAQVCHATLSLSSLAKSPAVGRQVVVLVPIQLVMEMLDHALPHQAQYPLSHHSAWLPHLRPAPPVPRSKRPSRATDHQHLNQRRDRDRISCSRNLVAFTLTAFPAAACARFMDQRRGNDA